MNSDAAQQQRVSRRHFLVLALSGIPTVALAGCAADHRVAQEGVPSLVVPPPDPDTSIVQPTSAIVVTPEPPAVVVPTTQPTAVVAPTIQSTPTATPAVAGVLVARPAFQPQTSSITPGVQSLGLTTERDTLLYVPARYTSEQPTALAVLFHGAGGMAEHGLSILQGLADEHNLLLLASASRRQTWDMIVGGYGPDVDLIDRALDIVFTRYNIDAAQVAIGGFSDGASYALSLGIANGDLFTHIMAFSPGYMAPSREAGKPRIFISHGTRDDVLPIDACSRKLVPRLENNYDLRYREFDGPHTVPPEMTQEAVAWFKE